MELSNINADHSSKRKAHRKKGWKHQMIEFQFPVIFHFSGEWYFVTKMVLTYCEKKLFYSYLEKLLKFEAEGREFAKFLRSLEQFIQTVKGQNKFW